MFAAAQAVTETLGVPLRDKSASAKSSSFVPPWKAQLENKLACMRKDLSGLVSMQLKNTVIIKALHSRYLDNCMSLPMAIEILRQKAAAVGEKLRTSF